MSAKIIREILFRGKRTDNGEWWFGNVSLFDDDDFVEITRNDGLAIGTHKVIPETLGQYTGLKDKNGVKIFEGDIVECWSEGVKARGTVQQRIDGLWIIYPAWQKNIMWGLCPDNDGNTTVEIVGNIHDNPELLKGGADNV